MIETFQPLLDAARGVDLTDTQKARTELARRFDPTSPEATALNTNLIALLDAGRIADRGAMPVKWSRVAKSGEPTSNFSIDAVHMDGAGPHHRHPAGEVNWCVPLAGDPRFEGTRTGWVVMAPGSDHVPTVSGGRMLVVYLLPEGKIEFTKT